MRCDAVLWTAPCPLSPAWELREDPAPPRPRQPPIMSLKPTRGHLLLLLHLILITPLRVGGSIPSLQMKKLRCKGVSGMFEMKMWVSGGRAELAAALCALSS